MQFADAAIPVDLVWSSPFARWQTDLATLDSVDLAVQLSRAALLRGQLEAAELSGVVLGITVPQHRSFYGGPTFAAQIGAPLATGPMVSQACATSVASLVHGALTSQATGGAPVLVAATDRTSNAPTMVYPSPARPGATPVTEAWVLDNFSFDPWARASMLAAAEAVAADEQIDRAELDELTLLRYEQYRSVTARPWQLPVDLGKGKTLEHDVGVHETTAEGLAKLSPVDPEGQHTYGSQTHPADGAAGVVVGGRAWAGARGGVAAELLGAGFARVDKSRMPKAPVPAARQALEGAGLGIADVDVVTTHAPFAVNDIYFARETGFPIDRMNPAGSSLIYGHPQAPTGLRAIAELLGALEARGGGVGLFTGCAAGDTAGAVVLRLDG
jgi:acetyl-CoA C-acetyltransferase